MNVWLSRCAKTFSFTSDKIVAGVELSLLETRFRNAQHIIELLVHVWAYQEDASNPCLGVKGGANFNKCPSIYCPAWGQSHERSIFGQAKYKNRVLTNPTMNMYIHVHVRCGSQSCKIAVKVTQSNEVIQNAKNIIINFFGKIKRCAVKFLLLKCTFLQECLVEPRNNAWISQVLKRSGCKREHLILVFYV